MDSESTSRSSVKDFSSATSSGLTPATSSRISARPEVISSRVAIFSVIPLRNGDEVLLPAGTACPSGAAHDLAGVGEAAAEAEQQLRGGGGPLPALGPV